MTEERIARFTQWFRTRPSSLEFWELVVTDDRLLWCFVGETFRSPLLRADMGERGREDLADLSPDEITAFDDRNFVVPIADLVEIRLVPGTLIRRERLVVRWNDTDGTREVTLYRTKRGSTESESESIRRLAGDPRFECVELSVESSRTIRRRLREGLG